MLNTQIDILRSLINIIKNLLLVILCFIINFSIVSYATGDPIWKTAITFVKSLHVLLSLTHFRNRPFYNINPYICIYLIIILYYFLARMLAILQIMLKKPAAIVRKNLATNAFITTFFILFLIAGIQTQSSFIENLKFAAKHNKASVEEWYASILKDVYNFSANCKKNLKGHFSAILITDMDLSSQIGMATHRRLAYFLYPIDIRVSPSYKPVVVQVYYKKKDAINLVPRNFKIIYKFNNESLLAIKKDHF